MGLIVEELTKKFGEKTAVDHLSFSWCSQILMFTYYSRKRCMKGEE